MNLARELQNIETAVRASPWAGREHYRGYAVMVLPFSSGHMLGLRVFPQSDIAPYKSVWHCTPEGEWTIHNDGPSLNTTCPRWWGPALKHADLTGIELTWTGPSELRVEMRSPRLEWTMRMGESPLLRSVNAVSAAMPLWTYRSAPVQGVREWMAKRLFDMGDLRFSFTTPSEQQAVVALKRVFSITESTAIREGQDLGVPLQLRHNPTIGGIALPTRPMFMVGQAFGRIKDPKEYEATREWVRAAAGSERVSAGTRSF